LEKRIGLEKCIEEPPLARKLALPEDVPRPARINLVKSRLA
jgi:hypothetical protein